MICLNCKKEYNQTGNRQKYCIPCKIQKCLFCKKDFFSVDKPMKMKFCSQTCSNRCHTENTKKLIANRGTKRRTWHLRTDKRPHHAGIEYVEWRKKVFERDNYTCQICKQVGGRLQADHIKPYAKYPELRLKLSNGRTLCIDCHKKTDSYGWKNYWNNYIAQERLDNLTSQLF